MPKPLSCGRFGAAGFNGPSSWFLRLQPIPAARRYLRLISTIPDATSRNATINDQPTGSAYKI